MVSQHTGSFQQITAYAMDPSRYQPSISSSCARVFQQAPAGAIGFKPMAAAMRPCAPMKCRAPAGATRAWHSNITGRPYWGS